MANAGNLSYPGEATIFRALSAAGGRYDALQFVANCHGNLVAIELEIQEQEELIKLLTEGPMKTGATPRIYKDAYLLGLREAIELLRQTNTERQGALGMV